MGRIPIGASDYAIARYTLNETAGDTALASFSIDAGQDVPDPVRQGGAGDQARHPLLGQPVDAADLDEERAVPNAATCPRPSTAAP